MPNITPNKFRNDYKLYENKPCTDENADDCQDCLETRIALAGHEIAYDEWGDSRHYRGRTKNQEPRTRSQGLKDLHDDAEATPETGS
jgi:biotin synthase